MNSTLSAFILILPRPVIKCTRTVAGHRLTNNAQVRYLPPNGGARNVGARALKRARALKEVSLRAGI
jgi:hypothetical protein